MTTAEACGLVVELTRQLAAARSEAAAFRLVLQHAIHHAHTQHVELERLRERYYSLLDARRRAA
jgi:hypothetical protein